VKRWPRLHLAGSDLPCTRNNALSVAGWRALYDGCRARAHRWSAISKRWISAELDVLERDWPHGLAQGVIHADLFPRQCVFSSATGCPG